MSVLLARDQVQLYAPGGEADAHGWQLPGTEPDWSGAGNLQMIPGLNDPQAADAGGHGPFMPAHFRSGVLYLPPDAPARDGTVADIGGMPFVLSQVRRVLDPSSCSLDCIVATAQEWCRHPQPPETEPPEVLSG